MKKILLAFALLIMNLSSAFAAEDSGNMATAVLYTSPVYGYTIPCPKKPNIIPASALYEGAKGEVLIFENEEYFIKHAWVIRVDAFKDEDVPDFNELTGETGAEYLKKMKKNYDDVGLAPIADDNVAFFGVTAKEIEIDSNGDGKPDTIAQTDQQTMEVFFRTKKGGRYHIQLIDNPVLRAESMRDCRLAVTLFKD
ncbi:MAG: hypothetical protein IKN43_11185 [Selenomonadaceae bacterium]|nr:hypothetical protein [Selenomonadaceae bacterium]